MCESHKIDFEVTTNINRVLQSDYDILISNNKFINPLILPATVKVIFGPQFWVFPSGPVIGPYNSSLEFKAVYNSLSLWNKQVYLEQVGSFIMPICQFPFAVDVERLIPPVVKSETYDCLVYSKHRKHSILNSAIAILNDKHITYKIVTYGSYDEKTYMELLHTCKFMVCVDAHESQGFALEEAMSCNVPLLVIDATSMYDESNDGVRSVYENQRPKHLYATSVPYWSDECGIKITNTDNLPVAIDTMMESYKSFTPREYILRELSPSICMKRILDYFHI